MFPLVNYEYAQYFVNVTFKSGEYADYYKRAVTYLLIYFNPQIRHFAFVE